MKRSKFSLSHTQLLSGDMGVLIPCGLTEVLPGDSIQHSLNCLVRCAPMLAPVMHKVNIQIAHWFVPHRLVWEDWEDFITGGPDGLNASVFPTINTGAGFAINTLGDYLGVPTGVANRDVSALPFRGYQMIFNEFYRDQDLVLPAVIDLTSGPDTTTNTGIRRPSWTKDYFTTSRPWEQKGPAITIPLGTSAPVNLVPHTSDTDPMIIRGAATGATANSQPIATNSGPAGEFRWGGANTLSVLDPNGRLQTDLTGASSITINLLREAFALQRFEEARARFGSRYVEYLRYLGVRSSDARLQRPEFLGGGRYPIQFSEVLQTAEGEDPVGEMRGHGIGAARSNRYRRYFEEHGYIFSIITIKPEAIYMNGIPRTWNRRTREDFFQKELQHIGQQPVLNKEVYLAHTTPDGTFGYQDRYDEYRQAWSSVHGEFRTTLDFWHFARNFTSDPALNNTFVLCAPTTDPFAVPAADNIYVMARHSIQARRIVASKGNSFIF